MSLRDNNFSNNDLFDKINKEKLEIEKITNLDLNIRTSNSINFSFSNSISLVGWYKQGEK